jgi:hypothetical protein
VFEKRKKNILRRHILVVLFHDRCIIFTPNYFTQRTKQDRGTLLVAQLVEALRYKPEGRGLDSRWCHWNFSLTQSFWPQYDPGFDSTSNRNEYQEYFLRVKAAVA